MVAFYAAALAIPFVPGIVDNVVRRADDVADVGRRITPDDLGIRAISDNARLNELWDEALTGLYHGKGGNGAALREYLQVIGSGGVPSGDLARRAFDSVSGSFYGRVRKAIASGEEFPGYVFDTVHHWNWTIGDYALDALDPRQLYPVSEAMHKAVHAATTIGPHLYKDPINPLHAKRLDTIYPLLTSLID